MRQYKIKGLFVMPCKRYFTRIIVLYMFIDWFPNILLGPYFIFPCCIPWKIVKVFILKWNWWSPTIITRNTDRNAADHFQQWKQILPSDSFLLWTSFIKSLLKTSLYASWPWGQFVGWGGSLVIERGKKWRQWTRQRPQRGQAEGPGSWDSLSQIYR